MFFEGEYGIIKEIGQTDKFEFVCEKPMNKRMLICVACGNGSFELELSHQSKEAQIMLNENIKRIRKSKGLSQEELAIKLNVVRQTVSKWENGGSHK